MDSRKPGSNPPLYASRALRRHLRQTATHNGMRVERWFVVLQGSEAPGRVTADVQDAPSRSARQRYR